MKAAANLFSERGYHGVSVQEVSRAANVNVSLISYHFGGKNGLLVAIFGGIARAKIERGQELLSSCQSRSDVALRLRLFLESFIDFYLENPPLVRLFFRELDLGRREAVEVFDSIFPSVQKRLLRFIKHAIQKGYLRPGIDPRVQTYLLMGPVTALMRGERSARKYYKISLTNKSFRETLTAEIISGLLKSPA